MKQFIGEYELLISRVESAGQKCSQEVKGFALMRKAGRTDLGRTLIYCQDWIWKRLIQSTRILRFNVQTF